jgi:predicted SAM-dependent methyltransferase
LRTLSPGEFSATRSLLMELRVSHYHRRGLKRIQRRGWLRPSKLNLGCGSDLKDGFLNVDLLPGGDLTLDLRRGLPFDSESCELIFSEHFFEHIEYPHPASDLLRDCFRVLKHGGSLRISVPDTEWPLMDYPRGNDGSYFRACIENAWWHPNYCTTRLEHINFHFRQGDEHRFAYDEETMTKALEGVGFKNVHRVSFDPTLDSQHREVGSLVISALKL